MTLGKVLLADAGEVEVSCSQFLTCSLTCMIISFPAVNLGAPLHYADLVHALATITFRRRHVTAHQFIIARRG